MSKRDYVEVVINGVTRFEFESEAIIQQSFDKDKLFLFKEVNKFKVKGHKKIEGNIYNIIEEVCNYYKIPIESVTDDRRGSGDVIDAKKMIALLTKNTHKREYVAKVLGGKTHGTISTAIKKAENRDSVGKNFDEALMFIKSSLIAKGHLYSE